MMYVMIQFSRISNPDPVVDYLAEAIAKPLSKGKRVLWLVCGGSSIEVAARVSQKLQGQDLTRLAVTLTDERYGEVGHADSNWHQLAEHGFLLAGARLRPVLVGAPLDATVAHFADILEEELDRADFRIALYGIGADGHVAGILPGSPAVESDDLAAGYDAGKFTRLTMTFPAIEAIDEALVYAVGEAKRPVFEGLETEIPLEDQPAQILKSVPELTIFNDQIGESV
jgi:6-phosphogluconolactonase